MFVGRGKPDILGTRLVRRIILILHGLIQQDLSAVNQAVNANSGDQNPRSIVAEVHGPVSVFVHIKARNALYGTPLLYQPFRQRPAEKIGRCAFEAIHLDLFLR